MAGSVPGVKLTLERRLRQLVVEGAAGTAIPGSRITVTCGAQQGEITIPSAALSWRLMLTLPAATPSSTPVLLVLRTGRQVKRGVLLLDEAIDATAPALLFNPPVFDPLELTLTTSGWWTGLPEGAQVDIHLSGTLLAHAELGLHRPDVPKTTLLTSSSLGWRSVAAVGDSLKDGTEVAVCLRHGEAVLHEARCPLVLPNDRDWAQARRRLGRARGAIEGLSNDQIRRRLASAGFGRLFRANTGGFARVLRTALVKELVKRGAATQLLRIRLFNGDIVDVDPGGDWVMARKILFEGGYEIGFLEWIAAQLTPGETVIDVGSAYGLASLAAAKAVGPSGRVVAIDANPESCRATAAHALLNERFNIAVVECAISDHDGVGTLAINTGGNLGASTLVPDMSETSRLSFSRQVEALTMIDLQNQAVRSKPGSAQVTVRNVQLSTLDLICAEHGLRDVALVKIDIEGAELLALRGARALMDGAFGTPPVIALEHSSLLPTQGGALGEIFATFEARGWGVHLLSGGKGVGGVLRPVQRFEDLPAHDNIICVPPQRAEATFGASLRNICATGSGATDET